MNWSDKDGKSEVHVWGGFYLVVEKDGPEFIGDVVFVGNGYVVERVSFPTREQAKAGIIAAAKKEFSHVLESLK